MSHFTVLVIGDDVEGQLAPYDENIEVEGYKSHVSEHTLQHYIDVWKRRDDPPEPQRSLQEMMEGAEPLPPTSVDHIPDPSLPELLAWLQKEHDYEEYGIDDEGLFRISHYNPKSKWDWYEIGGRWRGYFKLKEGAMDKVETLAVMGRPGSGGNPPRYDADHTLKKYIDIEGMRDAAGSRAGESWDRAHAIIGDLPEALSWRQVLAKHTEGENDPAVDVAREEYRAQPRVRAVSEHDQKCRQEDRWDDALLGFADGVEQYQVTRESFVQDARDRAISTYAYVKDGEWYAPGEMGWWCVSTDSEKDMRRFVREFNQLLDELPDDTLLTVVDCHI